MIANMVGIRGIMMFLVVFGIVMQAQLSPVLPLATATRVLAEVGFDATVAEATATVTVEASVEDTIDDLGGGN